MSQTIAQAIAAAVLRLKQAGIDGAPRDARLLMAEALGIAPNRLTLVTPDQIPPAQAARFEGFVTQRLHHMPVARILAKRAFWGREFALSPDVLDPRPETEILIAEALKHAPAQTLLDLGTGSGIIAVTLLCEWPGTTGLATDLSDAALAIAQGNATHHGVKSRLEMQKSDWYTAVTGQFDLILSNPPYIAACEMPALAPDVRLYDPHMALSDGADGLSAYRAIASGLRAHLAPGGRVLLEIGPTQGRAVAELLLQAGLSGITTHLDFDGRDRVVSAFSSKSS